jgi:hypothetical protein
MRTLLTEVDKRVLIRLNKNIRPGESNGVMDFGEQNNYPQIIERLINGSVNARSIANINSRFLIGSGFENEVINSVPVGKDIRGKDITLLMLLKQVCSDLSIYNGCYIHNTITLERKVKSTKYLPFKNCRFTKQDDLGYCSSICYYDNWEKDPTIKKRFNPEEIKTYPIFNLQEQVFASQVTKYGIEENGKNNFPGQVNFLFLDNQFLYPLAVIDSVYMDADTESQISIYKNNQLRNGMIDKVVMRVQSPTDDRDREALQTKVKSFLGADGDPVLVLEDEVDENGEIKKTGAFAIDKIPSNINDKLFETWEKSLMNNIRKAYYALPALLIDYEESKLGTTSGEAIIQATQFYNSMTRDHRNSISQFFKEIFSNFDNDILAKNDNWKIKELTLYDNATVKL